MIMGFFTNRKKGGTVYLGKSTRTDGSEKIYTGITRRPVKTRWREHINSIHSNSKRTWVSKGTYFKPTGAFFSRNPEKAERTVKSLKPHQKRYLARGAAMRFKKRKSFWE